MSVEEQIKETKQNGLKVEAPLVLNAEKEYMPDLPPGCYTHLDSLTLDEKSDLDLARMRCWIWVSVKRSTPEAITELRTNPKYKIIQDTSKIEIEVVEIGGHPRIKGEIFLSNMKKQVKVGVEK